MQYVVLIQTFFYFIIRLILKIKRIKLRVLDCYVSKLGIILLELVRQLA